LFCVVSWFDMSAMFDVLDFDRLHPCELASSLAWLPPLSMNSNSYLA
jgi:hypothetical protein